MRIMVIMIVMLALILALPGTASAAWHTGAQGDQYFAVNAAMEAAAAAAGISPETFVSIYNAANPGDSLGGFSDAQLAAACEVMISLSAYRSVLDDYETVYNNLGCSTRLVTARAEGPTRSSLPSTGIALALLTGSGVVGIGATLRLLRKNR